MSEVVTCSECGSSEDVHIVTQALHISEHEIREYEKAWMYDELCK